MKWKAIVCGALLTVATAAPANATPVGLFVIGGGANGVSVGLTFIDWDPAGPPDGAFSVTAGTTLTSAVGNPTVGDAGTILDIDAGSPSPLVDFMTVDSLPGLGFDLVGIGPGSLNTNCAGLAIGGSCSPFVGSPFVLTFLGGTNTLVSLSAFGTAYDGTTPSNWTGAFTTQLSTMTPADVQAFFGCTPGLDINGCTNFVDAIHSSYSGEFNATAVPMPEPVSLALVGMGLLGAGIRGRRRK
jgi:hypothetical protein